MGEKELMPYGKWPSQVSASIVSRSTRLDDVQWAANGQTLVWSEGRSGATVLVSQAGASARQELTDEQSPRGGVGYGGGAFETGRVEDVVIFADADGRLYRRSLGLGRPRPLTPAFKTGGQSAPAAGIASPALSPDGKWVAYVFSDGHTDLLALADASGQGWPTQLTRGADFYMMPAWHPSGGRMAWVEWDHPDMPWDGTRVQLARLEGSPPRVVDVQTVGGGSDVPAQQPLFSPDGRWLSFIEESGEWPNLVLFDLQSGERRILVAGDGFELSSPAWVQGVRSTGWSHDSSRIYYFRQQGPNTTLWVVSVDTGRSEQIDTAPYTHLAQLAVNPRRDALAFIAAGSRQPAQVVVWENHSIRPVAYSTAATYEPDYLPEAREISWQSAGGAQAYGLYYPPSNPRFAGQGAPPAILHIHGGPTSLAPNRFNSEAAYFTSRGYAWVEVNYRGSTGYGRSYRHAMRSRWGEVDVEDAASCAEWLSRQGLANPRQLIIMGGSAGGYTVLNTLARHPGLFKAGICLYGVANLFALDLDTHKFESHYNATLVGKLPEAAERYHQWSPVFHAGNIRDALYIFQGSEDRVVPPSQAEEIVSALKEKGVPHHYKLYEGEGHGFRKAETLADYLKETERFLQQHVLFAP